MSCMRTTKPASSGSRQTRTSALPRVPLDWEGRTGSIAYLAKMLPRISETFILKEALALKRHGLPVRIYSLLPPTRDAQMHAEAIALLPEVTVLPQPGWSSLRCFLAHLRSNLRHAPRGTISELVRALLRPRRRVWRRFFRAVVLSSQLRRDRCAHLHAAWAHTPASVARSVNRMGGIPWSMAGHAKDIHLSQPASLAKKLASARFTLTCTRANEKLLRRLARTHGLDPRDCAITMLHHGVDTQFFSPRVGAVADPPLLLTVARLVPKKGLDLIISAAALLRDRGSAFSLEIIGEGPLRADLTGQIRALRLEDHVHLRGMLKRVEVREAYHRASVVLLASRITPAGDRDGIPNTLAEAMACGVPVIATKLPSIIELITDEETGLLVAPEKSDALAEAITKLIGDPDRRHRMGQAARRRICSAFDAEFWEARVAARLQSTAGIEKVLYISGDRGVPIRGSKGASVHVRSVVQALHDHNVHTRILSTRRGPRDGPEVPGGLIQCTTGKGVKRMVHRIARGAALAKALLRLIDNLPLYRGGCRQIDTWRPDVLYERYALTSFAGTWLARRARIAHILEVNAPLAEEEARFRGLRLAPLARWAEGWILRRADRVVVVSTALAQHAQRLGVRPGKIMILPNGIDPRIFHHHADGSHLRQKLGLNGQFVIGFSGTLKPWHGLHHLIGAMARIKDSAPGIDLLVIGDGPERAALEAQARQAGLGTQIHFLGSIAHDDVGTHLAACDVLTAPYGQLENLWFSPLKVAEYLAVGRPVIASAIGQLKELYGEDSGVVLTTPGDEESLARELTDLATNKGRYAALRSAARAACPLTWQEIVGRILSSAEDERRKKWSWAK